MGIQGLRTFTYENAGLFLDKEYKLHDTTVVVDATNIERLISRESEIGRSSSAGGDLPGYAKLIRTFLDNLVRVNVRGIFVYAGVLGNYEEKCRKKMFEIFGRTRDMYNDRRAYHGEIFPIQMTRIFKSILLEYSDTMTIHSCMFEADTEIVRLARFHKAPVLSSDTDFYLMDIEHGVIEFLIEFFLHSKDATFIECIKFSRDIFLRPFRRLDPIVLASLKYLVKMGAHRFTHQPMFHISDTELTQLAPSSRPSQVTLKKLLFFMCDTTTDGFIQKISKSFAPGPARNELVQDLKQIFRDASQIGLREDSIERAMIEKFGDVSGSEICIYLLRYLNHNSADVLVVLQGLKLYLGPILDDFSVRDSNRACSYSMMAVFGRLLRHNEEDDWPSSVYDRVANEYQEKRIEQARNLPSFGLILIKSIRNLASDEQKPTSIAYRRRLMLSMIKSKSEDYEKGLSEYTVWFGPEASTQAMTVKLLLDCMHEHIDDIKLWDTFKRSLFTCFGLYMGFADDAPMSINWDSFDNRLKELDFQEMAKQRIRLNYEAFKIIRLLQQFGALVEAFNSLNSLLNEPLARFNMQKWLNFNIIYNLNLIKNRQWLHSYQMARFAFY